jgi:hypothetical protein
MTFRSCPQTVPQYLRIAFRAGITIYTCIRTAKSTGCMSYPCVVCEVRARQHETEDTK